MRYDVIVIGVGSMGSAACYHLAKRDAKVLALEQFDIAHDRGSHAGQSRLIRKAYFEHPDYVPLLDRAYELWEEMEKESLEKLFHKTGILYAGNEDGFLLSGIRQSSEQYNIQVDKTGSKWPQFQIPDLFHVYFEPDAGFVRPEKTIETLVSLARKYGAEIKSNTPVQSWNVSDDWVRVITTQGEFEAKQLVICSGAFSSGLLPSSLIDLKVTRQLLAWFEVDGSDNFKIGHFPCFGIEEEKGLFYGFPILPGDPYGREGLKIAYHCPGTEIDPREIKNFDPRQEEKVIRGLFQRYFEAELGKVIEFKSCLYTYSPDEDFILGRLPGFEEKVTIAMGFSGHGFKFVPVIGEMLADMSLEGRTDHPIDFLNINRLI